MLLDARYYDPRSGRFLSEDPIGFNSPESNLYNYVLNNPLSYSDPNGKSPLHVAVVGLAVVLGGKWLVNDLNLDQQQSKIKSGINYCHTNAYQLQTQINEWFQKNKYNTQINIISNPNPASSLPENKP